MCLRATVPYYLSNLGQVEDSFIVPVDLLVHLQLLGRWEFHKAEKNKERKVILFNRTSQFTCTVLIESKPEYSIEPIIFGYIAKKNRHYSN